MMNVCWILLILIFADTGYATSDPDVDGRLTADRDILFDTIFVDIRGITLQSAIMEWSIPEDERIFNLYIVSCTCRCGLSPHEYTVSSNVNSMMLRELKPFTLYTCTLSAQKSNNEMEILFEDIQFSTLNFPTGSPSPGNSTNDDSTNTNTKSGLTLFLVTIAIVILLLAVSIGGCALIFKMTKKKKPKQNSSSALPSPWSKTKTQSCRNDASRPKVTRSFNHSEDRDQYKRHCGDAHNKYELPCTPSTPPPDSHTTTANHQTTPHKDEEVLSVHSSGIELQYDDYKTPCESNISLTSAVHISLLSAPQLPTTATLVSEEEERQSKLDTLLQDKYLPMSGNSDTIA